MSNTLGVYDEVFYAQEALIWLQKNLSLAGRVYRALDSSPNQIGSTISVRRPSTFTAITMPAAAADLATETVTVTLDQWYGCTFSLTDKELAYTRDRIIEEHIGPAAFAVANKIDTTLWAEYKNVPWYVTATSPLAVADITGVRKVLATNGAPMNDGRLHLVLSPTLEEEALRQSAFTQWTGSGATGEQSQISGNIGQRFGFEISMNQNAPTHTAGVAADATGAMNATVNAGLSTIAVKSLTAGATLVAGDTFVIAGNTQRYVVTANASDGNSDGVITGITIYPALVAQAAEDAVVTFNLVSGEQSLGFHRDAFALAMGVLPDNGNQLGARVFSAVDSSSGLSIRARVWYDGTNAKTLVGLDALWGVKTLNGNLACRLVD